MTWTATERTTGTPISGSSDIVTASFTPAANSLLVLIVVRSDDGSISSVTGHGAWSNISTETGLLGGSRDVEIWACRIGASPSSGTVTIARGYVYDISYQILDFTETAGIAGSTAADGFGTVVSSDAYYAGGPHTLSDTLASFAQSTNLTLVVGFSALAYSGSRWNTTTGFTELSEWDSSSSRFHNGTHYQAAEDTSPSIELNSSWTDGSIIAVEVKHAASSGQAVVRKVQHHARRRR